MQMPTIVICPIFYENHTCYKIYTSAMHMAEGINNTNEYIRLDYFENDAAETGINIENTHKNLLNIFNVEQYSKIYQAYVLLQGEDTRLFESIQLPSLKKSKIDGMIYNQIAPYLNSEQMQDNVYVYDKKQAMVMVLAQTIFQRLGKHFKQLPFIDIKHILPLALFLKPMQGIVQIDELQKRYIYTFNKHTNDIIDEQNKNSNLGGLSLNTEQKSLIENFCPNVQFATLSSYIQKLALWHNAANKQPHLKNALGLDTYTIYNTYVIQQDKKELNISSALNTKQNFDYKPNIKKHGVYACFKYYAAVVFKKYPWSYLLLGIVLLGHIIGLNALLWQQQNTIQQINQQIDTNFHQVSSDPIQDAVIQLQRMQKSQEPSLMQLNKISPILKQYLNYIVSINYDNQIWTTQFKDNIPYTVFEAIATQAKTMQITAQKQNNQSMTFTFVP
jgi:hypothetical protein